ncbi:MULTISPECIES: MarR family winged helix-turn-helix transcriptional regulator [Bradyrhizobium]|jgi:DNA-binding MarR family transcriptional regulator|uniref:MarR family transcriptional regulator n=1 Tax=Bradyrhizobium ottawaense TaxID=931866 RepID=A0A2U8PFK9_9BRAD|nr:MULTISPECIES: MarR family transcriptional regulator [Bradyrhizobium]AWL96274.1 MarR family transcriptional regulator [Bradyrhizobium ottawaense]MBR1288138.1 MarR family transcriptional regulator [Bradyrhizobium ottawaense]MBR1328330.1 MarR family transcriptional regulator [Bradyrhizobium ottawaense]MBR1333901.1 MarR family transcriptional regulator [Bradyrhizobium ottawaense]MBR1364032.1 MarR family transcriptional regulator [Bradyrhizobium ottawaense]
MSRKSAAAARPKTAYKATAPSGDVRVPAPGEGKRGEQGYLGYLLRQAHAAVRLTMERALADLGVTSPQFAVLTMLNAYPGLSGADVARLTFLTPQTVGVIIRNLERDGAILMTPHPVHGRIQQWTLTPRGATLLKDCRERVIALEKRLTRGLDSKAETTIRRWLAGIATDLQQDQVD